MLKDAGRGDMVAKFLGGGLAKRPLESAPRLQRLVAKSVAGNPRGAPSNRMVAGLAQELSNRKVPINHPWNQKVMSQRGAMNADKAATTVEFPKAADIIESAKLDYMLSKCAGALMGMTRMIPVGKALSALKRAPAVAGAGAGVTKLAPPRPIAFQHPTLPGGKPAPIMPERPAGLLNSRPLVRPPNFNSTFDTSELLGLSQPGAAAGAAARAARPAKLPGLRPDPRGLPVPEPVTPQGLPGLRPDPRGLPVPEPVTPQGLPVGTKGTFGTQGTFGKVSALRNLSPLARIIGNMPASHFRF